MAYRPPFKVATGSIEERLMDSQAKPTRQDSIHFRKLGTISGDSGMIHVAVQTNIKKYLDEMDDVCDLPKKLAASHVWRRGESNKTVQDIPVSNVRNGNDVLLPGDKYFQRVLQIMEAECDIMKDEIIDRLLIWYSQYNRPGTSQDDESVVSMQERAAEEEINEVPNDNDLRVKKTAEEGIEIGKGKITDSQKSDWRYWYVQRINGNWPPSWHDLPKKANGQVDLRLWTTITNKINEKIDEVQKRRGEVYETVPGVEKKRRKRSSKGKKPAEGYLKRFRRFIFTLLAIAFVAISSVIYTQYEINKMAETANANLDSSIKVLSKHEMRLNIEEKTLENMKSTIKQIIQKLELISQRLHADELVAEVSEIMNSFFQQHRRIINGFTSLTENKLPAALVNMRAMTSTLIELRSKMERQNMRLGISKFDDIFNLDVSHAAYPNGMYCSMDTHNCITCT